MKTVKDKILEILPSDKSKKFMSTVEIAYRLNTTMATVNTVLWKLKKEGKVTTPLITYKKIDGYEMKKRKKGYFQKTTTTNIDKPLKKTIICKDIVMTSNGKNGTEFIDEFAKYLSSTDTDTNNKPENKD